MWVDDKGEGKQVDSSKPRTETAKPSAGASSEPPRTASVRGKTLSIRRLDPNSPTFGRDLERELVREGIVPK